jgi:hypothetical protein
MGLIGNVLTFIIFSRPAFKKNSISTYCRALAVIDCFTIYELASDIGFVFFDYFLIVMSDFGCKLSFYVNLCFSSISAWIIIIFSIDKVLSMKNRAKFIKKRSFQYSLISGIVMFHLIAYIVPIYMVSVTISKVQILCFLESFGSVIVLVCLIEGSLIPFLIMIGSSIISVRMLLNSAKNIQLHFNESDILSRTTRDFKYAITSITFNCMFVVLKLPIIIVTILESFIPDISKVTICVTYLFYFIFFSCGFLVHFVSNSIFRREFLVFLRLRKPNQVIYLNPTPNSRIQKPSTMGRKRLSLFL